MRKTISKKGLKKMIDILRNADQKLFYRGDWQYTQYHEGEPAEVLYCSMGIVAKELGYTGDFSFGSDLNEWVREKLKLPIRVTCRVMDLNDSECESYQCVANELEKEYLNK